MKKHILNISMVLLILLSSIASRAQNEKDLIDLNKVTRVGAYFQDQINNYRFEKKKDSLTWSNILEKAAHHHNLWMVKNNKLSHTETRKDKYFTGKTITDRINFVTGGKDELYCGENVQYFPFEPETPGVITDDEAMMIAELAFEYWKDSSGHNKNMLNPFILHATTFIYLDQMVWATSVFSCGGK
jgi:uncharacterized protein YkwD